MPCLLDVALSSQAATVDSFLTRPLAKPWHIAALVAFVLVWTGLWAVGADVKKLRTELSSQEAYLRTLYLRIQGRRFLALGVAAFLGWRLYAASPVPGFWGIAAGLLFVESAVFAGTTRDRINELRQ